MGREPETAAGRFRSHGPGGTSVSFTGPADRTPGAAADDGPVVSPGAAADDGPVVSPGAAADDGTVVPPGDAGSSASTLAPPPGRGLRRSAA
ncbi:hypothetical protein GCM10010305_41990 [Streptomyces termitum]|uniref:Uncharacterized protein n=1 Tax=Streptomyces termitum TaxID=67368 RepID=A0A918T5U6_9ACTN|nr:hypothetical protein GCM10010305_41990 [Streptomyces termitum]